MRTDHPSRLPSKSFRWHRLSVFGMAVVLVLVPSVGACPVGKTGHSAAETNAIREGLRRAKASRPKADRDPAANVIAPPLPTASSDQPWGGKDRARWRPEAILANALSDALNEGWKIDGVVDVLASAPVHMIHTGNRVYLDGQTNAGVEFADWTESELPIVATLVRFRDDSRKVFFGISEKAGVSQRTVTVVAFVDGSTGLERRDETLSLEHRSPKDSTPGWSATWSVPKNKRFGDLNTFQVVWVQLAGRPNVFPIDFRMPVYSTETLVRAARSARTIGQPPLDPLAIRKRAEIDRVSTKDALFASNYGTEWVKNEKNGNDLRIESVHGDISVDGKSVRTAVGGGDTWLVDRGRDSTFKNLYTCFDARNPVEEAKYGVPSGGGWHEIGDAAETIINSLERAPVLVGFATGVPWPNPPIGSGFEWKLTDVATVRFLQPGEGVMTAAGEQTWREDLEWRDSGHQKDPLRGKPGGVDGGRNYHWFNFHGATSVCTQEWVHPHLPTESNSFGLGG